jgi:hypothetical protein
MTKQYPYISIAFATGGIVIVVLAMTFASIPKTGVTNLRASVLGAKPHIAMLNANAFGPLNGVNALNGSNGTSQAVALDAASAPATSPSAGAGASSNGAGSNSYINQKFSSATAPVPMMATNVGRAEAGTSGAVIEKMMPPYQPVTYRYVYKGDPITVPSDQMSVYRHSPMSSLSDASPDLLRTAGLGSMDLSTFQSMKLQNVSFVEDRDNGYVITSDFTQGMVSINENWERKTNDPYRCVNGRCPMVESLTADQVPSDEDVIRITDAFLSSHGINASLYGKPRVDHSWKMYYAEPMMKATADGSVTPPSAATPDTATSAVAKPLADPTSSAMPIRAPDQISVTYPYLIEGQEVHTTNGDSIGMNVSVNLRDKTVAGAYGISIQSYDKSSYATEKDTARIMSFVERGGVYPNYSDPNAKAVDVELGAPTVALASFGHQVDKRWEDLYVPSLIFPVLKKPAEAPWLQNAVVIPLIKDLLVEPDVPQPTPYMLKGSEGVAPAVDVKNAVQVEGASAPVKQ